MYWKGYARKGPWPILNYSPVTSLEDINRTAKTLSGQPVLTQQLGAEVQVYFDIQDELGREAGFPVLSSAIILRFSKQMLGLPRLAITVSFQTLTDPYFICHPIRRCHIFFILIY